MANLRERAEALWSDLPRAQRTLVYDSLMFDEEFPFHDGLDHSPTGRWFFVATSDGPSYTALISLGQIVDTMAEDQGWNEGQINAFLEGFIRAIEALPPYTEAQRQAHAALLCPGCAAAAAVRMARALTDDDEAINDARIAGVRAISLGNAQGSLAAARCALEASLAGSDEDCIEYAPLAAARAIIAGATPEVAYAAGRVAVLAYNMCADTLGHSGNAYRRVRSRVAAQAAGEVIAGGAVPDAGAAFAGGGGGVAAPYAITINAIARAAAAFSAAANTPSVENGTALAAARAAAAAAAAAPAAGPPVGLNAWAAAQNAAAPPPHVFAAAAGGGGGGGGGAPAPAPAAAWPSIAACAPPTVLNVRRSQINIDIYTQEPFVQGQVVVRFDGNNNMMADAGAQEQFWAAESVSGRRPRSPFRQPPPVLVQGDFALFKLNIQEDEEEPSSGPSGSKRKRGAGGEGGGKRGAGTAWENRFRQTGKRKLRKLQRKTRKGVKRRLLKTRKR